jgi:hypothetical protein
MDPACWPVTGHTIAAGQGVVKHSSVKSSMSGYKSDPVLAVGVGVPTERRRTAAWREVGPLDFDTGLDQVQIWVYCAIHARGGSD